MEGKYWKIWTKVVCSTFNSDGKKLVRALGDWFTKGEESQHWTTYIDEADKTLYIAPVGKNSTWTAHETVKAIDQFFIYNHTPGRPCNPPKHAIKISLNSKTPYTLIYSNSNTAKVFIKNTMKKKENPSNRAMERVTGPLSTKTDSIQKIERLWHKVPFQRSIGLVGEKPNRH